MMNKIKSLQWVIPYARKHAALRIDYWKSKLSGRRFWEAHAGGATVRLSFTYPYQHLFAKHLAKGTHEQDWLERWAQESKKITSGAILDIGGYNGIYGLVAGTVNQNNQVFIFEPDKINVEHIERNILLNQLTNVRVVRAAIAEKSGQIGFLLHVGATAGKVADKVSKDTVPAITLSDWSRQAGMLPALMKFDISGIEQPALFSAQPLLERISHAVIFLEFYSLSAPDDERFWSYVKERGFAVEDCYPRSDGRSHYYILRK